MKADAALAFEAAATAAIQGQLLSVAELLYQNDVELEWRKQQKMVVSHWVVTDIRQPGRDYLWVGVVGL